MTNRTTRIICLLTLLISICFVAQNSYAQSGDLVWDPKTKSWVPKNPVKSKSQVALEQIRKLVEEGNSDLGINEARLFRREFPDSPGCEEAYFLEAQAYMNKGEYWEAYLVFRRQISAYPGGVFYERALDRQYQIAKSFLKGRKRRALKFFRIDATEDGVEILERIAALAPGTEIGEKAQLGLGDHYFDTGLYPEAVAAYDFFVKHNPQSKRKPYAMLQAARSCFLNYRGVNWEKAPLVDAAARYRVIAAAYPKLAKSEKIETILLNIRSELAHKLWNKAQFYERISKRKAAIYYYKKLLATYPKTTWATRARETLEEYGVIAGVKQTPEAPKENLPRPKGDDNSPRKPALPPKPDTSGQNPGDRIPTEPGDTPKPTKPKRRGFEDVLYD